VFAQPLAKADRPRFLNFWALFAGGLLVTVGLVLLWEEFIAPLLGRKT
jgi:hypothetical protein